MASPSALHRVRVQPEKMLHPLTHLRLCLAARHAVPPSAAYRRPGRAQGQLAVHGCRRPAPRLLHLLLLVQVVAGCLGHDAACAVHLWRGGVLVTPGRALDGGGH